MSFTATFNAFQVSGITKAEQHVLTAICTFADKHGVCWPSVETIANRCLSSVRTVQMHINALSAKGLLQRTMRAGRSSLIKVTVPTPATSAPLPPQILHPEPAIEPINTTTAAPTLPAAAMPPSLFPEIPEQPEQPADQASQRSGEIFAMDCNATPPITDIEQPANTTTEAPKTPYSASNEADTTNPTQTPATPVTAPAIEADPLAEVPATLLADLGTVRIAKKRPAKVTRTEAALWWQEAQKCGWDMQTVITTMILHGWARFQADWVQHVPPQTAPGTPSAPKVWQPEPHTPASASTLAQMKEKIAQMRARWKEESLNAPPPMRQ